MTDFKAALDQLNLSQYHDGFVNEGFDSWETLMDITESDLEVLGVKLGHRRRLQRAIFSTSGDRPPLPVHFQVNSYEETGQDGNKITKGQQQPPPPPPPPQLLQNTSTNSQVTQQQDTLKPNGGAQSRPKRKYRRHPKPDEHAPERPPSAYVIFSNQIRDKLKGQELSFTEIAKLVGERWQDLQAHEKEPCEREAQTLKDTYYKELRGYKKTPQYQQYQKYLVDFKAKHSEAGSVQGQDQADNKKPKLQHFSSRLRRQRSPSVNDSNLDGYTDGNVDGTIDGNDEDDDNDVDGADGAQQQTDSPAGSAQPSPTYSASNTDKYRRFPIPQPPVEASTASTFSTWRPGQPSLPSSLFHKRSATADISASYTATRSEEDDSPSSSTQQIPPSIVHPGARTRSSIQPPTLPSLTQIESLNAHKSSETPLLNWPLHTTLPPIDPRSIRKSPPTNSFYASPRPRTNTNPHHPPPPLPLKDSHFSDNASKASLSTLLRATEQVERDSENRSVGSSNDANKQANP